MRASAASLLYPALVLLSQIWRVQCQTDNTTSPSPLSFQPSNDWDGNDGSWSTFAVQIGSPPQAVRLLPSITGNAIWTVWSYACDSEISEINNCPSARGNVYNFSASSTWELEGNYSLDLLPQHYLPLFGGAVMGFDNITLDWQQYGGQNLSRQVIDAYVTEDLFLGRLGLSPRSINISDLNNGIPSLVGSLREQNLIPSVSWGYLAGAAYYSYPVSATSSLTFGGYDKSRLNASANLTLGGGSDPYRPYLLGIESITSEGKEFLAEPIITALDSLITQIWLPISACEAFEAAFDLVWNDMYQLYILDEAQHSALLARNASITFTLSQGFSNSTDRLNITLPYAAFDLTANPPLAGAEPSYYFPLKQAANLTQYTLGRTFLQEVYMLADFDNGNITLYQAVYPESSVPPNIITICPPNSTTCISSQTPPSSHGLSAGAIAGIVIGVSLLLLAILALLWFKCLRKQRGSPPSGSTTAASSSRHTSSILNWAVGVSEKPELDGKVVGSPRGVLDGGAVGELDNSAATSPRAEMGSASPGFSPSSNRRRTQTSSGGRLSEAGEREVLEMLGQQRRDPAELPGSPVGHELYGSAYWQQQQQQTR